MPVHELEPWNPFDTSDKTCFPDVFEALFSGSTTSVEAGSTVVDIDVLARHHAVHIDELHPPELGCLPKEVINALEDMCEAWFDEQTRIKAVRGDSPTPSCSFRLPGIPFKDSEPVSTVQHLLPGGTAVQGPAAPSAMQALQTNPCMYTVMHAIDSSAVKPSDAMQTAHWAGLQHMRPAAQAALSGNRASFAFAQVAGQGDGESPDHGYNKNTSVFTSEVQQQQQQAATQPQGCPDTVHPNPQQLPEAERAAYCNKAGVPGPAKHQRMQPAAIARPAPITPVAAAATPNSTHLSWLMKQNLKHLQQLLEPQGALPKQQERMDQTDLQLQQLQQNLEHQALQQRLSLLLQTNQQQLHQLLESHHHQQQQQLQESTQHACRVQANQWQQPPPQQLKQPASPQQLPSLLQTMQQQLSQLQLHQQQQEKQVSDSVPAIWQSGCYAWTAAGHRADTANAVVTRISQKAAHALTPPNARCTTIAPMKSSTRPRAAASAAATAAHACASPVPSLHSAALPRPAVGADGRYFAGESYPAWQPAVSTTAVSRSRSPSLAHVSPSLGVFNAGSRTAHARTNQQQASPALVAAKDHRARGSIGRRSGGSGGHLQAWRSLQVLQQQRWQQRLQVDDATGNLSVASGGELACSPTTKETEHTDLSRDAAVQTDWASAGSASADTGAQAAVAEAVTRAAAASTPAWGQSPPEIASMTRPGSGYDACKPVGTADMLAAMSPVAAAAALAAAAAVTAAAAVGERQSTSVQTADASLVTATAAAAAAAAAAAVVNATGLGSPAGWQQQQQQQQTPRLSGSALAAVTCFGSASGPPPVHVVRSLFGVQPSPVRAFTTSVTERRTALQQVVGSGETSTGMRTGRAAARYHDQEDLHAGPDAMQQQQQNWQHRRPLPWPQMPTLESKPHLSPMKAYTDLSCADRHSRPAGAASSRRPLCETTNSPGVVNQTTSYAAALAAARTAIAVPELHNSTSSLDTEPLAVAPVKEKTLLVDGSAAGMVMATAGPTAVTATATAVPCGDEEARKETAVLEAVQESSMFRTPTKQPIGHRVAASTPGHMSSRHAPAAMAAGQRGTLGAAGLSTVSGAVTVGSPALQLLWSGYKAARLPMQRPPAQTSSIFSGEAAGVQGTTNQQLPSTLTAVDAPGFNSAAAQAEQMPAGEAAAAVASIAVAPVQIDARFYPPSARNLLEQQPARAGSAAAATAAGHALANAAHAGTGVAPYAAGVPQQQQHPDHTADTEQASLWQLQLLLEQQLLEMDLLGKNAVEAAAAMARSRSGLVSQDSGGVAGEELLQQGHCGGVAIDSLGAQTLGVSATRAHSSEDMDAADTDSYSSSDASNGISTRSVRYRATAHQHAQMPGSTLGVLIEYSGL